MPLFSRSRKSFPPLLRLSQSALARSGPDTICTVFFLCLFGAWAQSIPLSIPQGYVATWEDDVMVMRPSAAADPEVAIRVYPSVADNDDGDTAVRRWAQSHLPAGVDPSALRVNRQTMSGVSVLQRSWKDGAQVRLEFILMPQTGRGRYRPVVGRMPSQPSGLLKQHSAALGYVAALIVQGKFQPNIPSEGKGQPVVNAALAKPTGNHTTPQRLAPAPAAVAGAPATEQVGRLAAEIETVGFMNRAQVGVGGMWIFIPKPVVLFRGGDALFDIGNLIRVTSVDADRAAHPRDWGRWKRSASGIELLQGDKWKKLDYPKTLERLPAGFGLSGDYEYLSGGGDTAIGGGDIIANNRRFVFRPDGKYSSDRLGFVSSNDQLGHTVVRSQSPVLVGRYRVDGYLLRLEPPQGPAETHVFVFDPKDPNTLWIDGHGYTRAH